jgi:ubiquinone/menaquinone biosynthesis C-methylase UbiE
VPARFYDDLFRAYERSPLLRPLMRAALDESLPVEIEPYSFVTMNALREIRDGLRLAAGELLVDLACGRGGPGMWVARGAGVRLIGVDFSAVAVTQARARVPVFRLAGTAEFRIGNLHATGLDDGQADALMCVDSFQFAADPQLAAGEAWRVLRPGGRSVFTCWQAREAGDPGVPEAFARLEIGHALRTAGFAEVLVAERPGWQECEQSVFRRALATDPGDDPALLQLRAEADRMLPLIPRLRRLIVTAVRACR